MLRHVTPIFSSGDHRTMLIHELKTIQNTHGYLPATALQALARRLNVPLYRLHGVASFYPHIQRVSN